ncbi:MAG: histidine kinase [Ferruginibacter sp.]
MKRVAQHIFFWLFYIALSMNMEYLWVSKVLPGMDKLSMWRDIFISSLLPTLPEIAFAYYLMYVGYERIAKRKAPLLQVITEILLALIACIVAIRLISFYILKYWVYGGKMGESDLIWDIPVMWRSLIYIGFSCGLALSLKLFRRQIVVAKREKELMQEKLGVELRLLRSQLHPHFLFNTLNNIYALTRKKSDDAPETLMKLSELLDFMLYRSNSDTISLEQEIKFLEDYIALEKIRYSNKLSIEFLKDIENGQAPVAPFLLLPLVENAFKHGAGETRENSFIHIEIAEAGEQLHFVVQNNYESNSNESSKEKLGLQNVRRRLELLYKEHTIAITATADNFKVELYINLLSYAKA